MPSYYDFHKSTYSNGQFECVEVATNIRTTVAIRDSKAPGGPCVTVDGLAWEAFLTALPERSGPR